jgi:hypothetical protein
MRRILSTIAATATIATLTATVAFAGGGVSGVATGHGQAVSDVTDAVTYVSGQAKGAAISALAKTHGATVSAAAKLLGEANAAAGKDKGSAAADAQGANADEPGGLKDSTSH